MFTGQNSSVTVQTKKEQICAFFFFFHFPLCCFLRILRHTEWRVACACVCELARSILSFSPLASVSVTCWDVLLWCIAWDNASIRWKKRAHVRSRSEGKSRMWLNEELRGRGEKWECWIWLNLGWSTFTLFDSKEIVHENTLFWGFTSPALLCTTFFYSVSSLKTCRTLL